ncbi:DUF928 domain-containing protein [Acaryochloris sp. CCMEE 5410]|uniref:DUF928 domain-containing protein n=1 Tax=Acaryochloris sp. CCMEE 5410 TaxID=310037 RepID=UPI001F28B984|nr:DUF928 domain-containing protein [Acaryochloris sp. CCMEE 5410]
MSKILSRSMPLLAKSIAIASIAGICLQALPSDARFNPGGTVGKPGNRRGLATRGGGCKASGNPTLTTLVPKSNVGLTASATPTFYWFIPQNTYQYVNFSLYSVDAEDNPTDLIYASTSRISGEGGLASVSIPKEGTTQSLEAGKSYRWMVRLLCSGNDRRGLSAMGWITYTPPSPQLANQLAVGNKADVYAEAGYWYDAVQELAQQKQANPTSPAVNQAWKELMESEFVQLNQLAAL